MDDFAPHKTLLALHRIVDGSLQPLLQTLDLRVTTEAVVAVDRSDLVALAAPDDPQAAIVRLEGAGSAVLILEPSLGHALLAAIWGEGSLSGGYTNVEAGILQQFVADACTAWNEAWQAAGLTCLPELAFAAPLGTVAPQLDADRWYAVRSVVSDGGDPVGVFLFCYPASALPALEQAHASIGWKSRVARGLSERDQHVLRERLERMGHLRIPAPVTARIMLPLGSLQTLERGDVIAFETDHTGEIEFALFDRPVSARLAATGDQLALAVGGDAPVANEISNDPLYAGDEA